MIASGRSRRLPHLFLVGVALVGALLLRLPAISEPSIERRETQSALLARSWTVTPEELPDQRRQVILSLRDTVKPIEPPILDGIAAGWFRLTGSESFVFPRLLSAIAWVIGAVFLYLIATRVTTTAGSTIALLLYLVWPYGVWHSRLFMPDALMVSAFLGAALLVVRYWERRSWRRFAAAGFVSALAVAIKPGVALLVLVGLFVGLALTASSIGRRAAAGLTALFAVVAASLSLGYWLVGTQMWNFISPSASTRRITPDLLATGDFWESWWQMISYLLRFPQPQSYLALLPLAAGLAGVVVARRGRPRAILAGLTLGYVAFALAFANYTSTHPYYSLVLIPILSLGIGTVAATVLDRLGGQRRLGRAAVLAAVGLVVAVSAYKGHATLTGNDRSARIADYRRIGEETNHTTRALIVDDELATPVMFWGWIVGRNWELDYNESLPPWLNRSDFDYLVVVGRPARTIAGAPVVLTRPRRRDEDRRLRDLRPAPTKARVTKVWLGGRGTRILRLSGRARGAVVVRVSQGRGRCRSRQR